MGLLELSLGSTIALATVAHALTLSGRDSLPQTGRELIAFVRAYLVPILTGELGPRLTIALLDDLTEKLDPDGEQPESDIRARSSIPVSSARRPIARLDMHSCPSAVADPILGVALVDADTIGRPALARALIRANFSVTVIDSPGELAQAHEAGEDFGVALVAMDHPLAYAIVQEMVARYPAAALVARCNDANVAHARLRELGLPKLELPSNDAPPEELVETIGKALGL